ncbi:Hsp20/alpha crystallin family protein [Chrysiogenes arsenatis]|uniref:Hsp20/alpha crystallin family protein n=1 Tax=Chrysiogenes arsenatis TaxID=309797 RepID=UPI00040CC62C|nr:Hsp20/alpha crystallin family protein [Chrysiogenes arsenatis]
MSEHTLATIHSAGTDMTQHEESASITKKGDTKPALPFVDILEYSDHLTLAFDLPGVARENLAISAEGDTLTISATLAHETRPECHHREFTPRDFYRQFRINRKFDLGRIQAKYENGELLLTIQKSPDEKPRKITIQ